MRTVAVTNLKGGVGKTTTTISLGAGMALKGLRVLLVDVDAQGNLAAALGLNPRHTLYEVLVDGKAVEQCLTPARPNLDLLAADDALLIAQPLIVQRPDWAHLLGRALKSVAARYDVALIDCAASLSVMNASALLSASDVVVPTIVESLAIRGIALLQRQLDRLGAARICCIVPTMFDVRQRQAHELMAELHHQYGDVVASPVRVNVRLSEAPAHGKTIYEHDPQSRGAIDYARLVEYLTARLRLAPVLHAPPASNVPVTAPGPASAAVAPALTSATHLATDGGAQPNDHGSGSSFRGQTNETCPTCGTLLQQAVLAGYRVRYCDHCHYHRQELIQGVRR